MPILFCFSLFYILITNYEYFSVIVPLTLSLNKLDIIESFSPLKLVKVTPFLPNIGLSFDSIRF